MHYFFSADNKKKKLALKVLLALKLRKPLAANANAAGKFWKRLARMLRTKRSAIVAPMR